jgi:Zn-dependent peptidase ImmA (M78 family)
MGNSNALQFEFVPGAHDQALGFGALRVWVGKSTIWNDAEGRGISWTWIDLLEQLSRAWPFLKYEETAPPRAYDSTLSLLRTGRLAATDFDFEPVTESTRATYIFLRRHNLATGIEGLYLPSFSLLREGRRIWVASTNVAKLMDLDVTLQTLTELGEAIAAHVSASGCEQERSRLAIKAWREREPALEAALKIELGSALVAGLVPVGQSLASYLEAENDDLQDSSLLAAARMTGAVPVAARSAILELLRSRPPTGESNLLRDISAEAKSQLPDYLQRAHQQGETLAKWARRKFRIAPTAKADPEEVLQRLGISVSKHHLGIEMVDAIGCWDCRHGPAVLVNLDGIHAQSPAGRRASLAHELAHVLIDRDGSLPAAEVLGGNVPRHPEQRANAFAAEFLLPKAEAIEWASDTTELTETTIKALTDRFGASREIAAWQILNSPAVNELNGEERRLLKSWTSTSDHWFLS